MFDDPQNVSRFRFTIYGYIVTINKKTQDLLETTIIFWYFYQIPTQFILIIIPHYNNILELKALN